MAKRAPRLQFTEEERASPELAPAIQKADKKIKKLEKAEAKIPKKEVKQRCGFRWEDHDTPFF